MLKINLINNLPSVLHSVWYSMWPLAIFLGVSLLSRPVVAQEREAVGANRQSASNISVRVALLSDTHSTRGTEEDQALYKGRYERVIEVVNAARVDVVLIAGDLTQSSRPEQFADFKAQMHGFQAPVFVVPGNHDVGSKIVVAPDGTRQGTVTATRIAQYEAQMGPGTFAYKRPGLRIIGFNSLLLGSGLPGEAAQWQFLEDELARPSKTPTLLLSHFPLFLQTPDEASDAYWNVEPQPRQRLLQLIARGGVKAVLSGHLHRPLQNTYQGVLHLTTPPVSFGLPRGVQAQGWTLLTVSPQGEITWGFQPLTESTQEKSTTPS